MGALLDLHYNIKQPIYIYIYNIILFVTILAVTCWNILVTYDHCIIS